MANGTSTRTDKSYVRELGERIGYGNMMHLASLEWAYHLWNNYGIMGGEFVVGPCRAAVVDCGCSDPSKCDWCAGTGWLTKRVKQIKDGCK